MHSRFARPSYSFCIRHLAIILLVLAGWQSSNAQASGEIEHWRKRAEAGYLPEQMKLAHAFQFGIGVPRNASEAAYWALKAANQGDPGAQTDLGFAYLNGSSGPRWQIIRPPKMTLRCCWLAVSECSMTPLPGHVGCEKRRTAA
jgi:Sel1 repeat-containing protein